MPMPLDPTQVPSLGANGLPVPPVQQPQSAAPAQAKAASPSSQSIPQPQASPAQTSYDKDPVAAILNQTQLSKAQKATIWDAFHKTKNINDFTKVLKSIDFSKQQKASLWDLKNHSDPLSFPSTNLDTPNSKFAPTSSVDTAPPKQHVSFAKDVRSGMADSLNPIPALKQLSGVTGYEEQQDQKKQLASYLPKGVTLESATPQQYTAAVNQYSAVTQKNQVTPSEFYNTVKTKLLNEVHTHPGYLAGQAAGLAFQYVLGKGLGKIIPTEAGTDVLTADQHSLLESSDEGKALKANMTASERQKPGTAKALGNFASLMPSSQKTVTKILAARKILLAKVMDQVADNFMSKIASGDKVLGDVKEAAAAANQDRIVNGKINDETLSELLTNNAKAGDMKATGDTVASHISDTEKSVKETRNMLYDGLGEKLDEAGVKVSTKDTTLDAIKIWRKHGVTLPSPLREAARTALESFIPFDDLDESALDLVNSRLNAAGSPTLSKVDFFKLKPKDQDELLSKFKFQNLTASESMTLGNYLTSNMKNLTATTGLKSYVFSGLNDVFKKSMADAFEAASPELADTWKSAQGLSYAQSQRLKSSMYRSILNQNNKLSGEALTSKIINNPADARTIMQNIDKDIDLESNTLVHSGSKYTDMLRKYTLDQLSTIGEDDPSKALDALQDQTKGYKDILGYKTKNQSAYDTAVGYWKNKVSLFNSSEAGTSRKFLAEVTGTTEPQAIISKLIDPDKEAFADYIVKEAGSNTKVKEQLGHSMLSSIMDNSTNNGHFGTPEAVTDPVKLADNLQRSMPQLRKFLSPEVTKNLDTLSGVMRQMSIKGGQSMIGVYRSWTEGFGLLAGGFLLGGHAGLSASAALLVAPKVFMMAATNPTWTKLMIEGFHLSPGTQEYISWTTKMAIVSNQIRAAAGAINKSQTQTPAQVPSQPKALSPVPAQ